MGFSTGNDFRVRVSPRDLPEYMDGDCSYEDFRSCMHNLEQINRLLLGYQPTLNWLGPLLRVRNTPMHIVDVGSGGGGLLRHIATWVRRRGVAVRLTGIDLNPYAARSAAEATPPELGITWVTDDATQYRPELPVDVIVSSLTVHHLEDDEIITLLRWMEATAQTGWFLTDLKRSRMSCTMFALWERVARWHPFVRHDGEVSFRRALRKADWLRLLAAAEVPLDSVTLRNWRPGRLCVGRLK